MGANGGDTHAKETRRGKLGRWWWPLTAVVLLIAIAWTLGDSRTDVLGAALGLAEAPVPPQRFQGFESSQEAWEGATPAERMAYVSWLAGSFEVRRAVLLKLLDQRASERSKAVAGHTTFIVEVLLLLSFLSFFVPLFTQRSYPGRRLRLWLYSIVSGLLLVLSVVMFMGLLGMLTGVSSMASAGMNPERAFAEAGFDYVHKRLKNDLVVNESDPEAIPLGPTMGALTGDPSSGFAANFLRNLKYLDVEAFEISARWLQVGYKLLRFLPHLVPYLLAVIYLLTIRGVFKEILTMPYRAVSGEAAVARRAIGLVLKTLFREFLSLVLLAIFVILVSASVNLCVHVLTHNVVELTMLQAEGAMRYLGMLAAPPNQTLLTLGLIAIPIYAVLAMLCVAAATPGTLFWARRVTQLRFHRGVKLRAHDGFWRKTTMAVIRLQWTPVVLLAFMVPIVRSMHQAAASTGDGALSTLCQASVLLLGVLLVGLVLFGAVRAAIYLVRFRPTRASD